MSRLDSMIRRLEAQRTCLDWAARAIAEVPGVVFEIGLGNGRTYDHLRSRLAGRDIIAFDRSLHAHPDCRPAPDKLLLGDINETLPLAAKRHAGRIALAHGDLGDGREAYGLAMAAAIGKALASALAPGGILLTDYPIGEFARLKPVPLPEGVAEGRYCIYRAGGQLPR
ncbi:MAG: hypothetical protein F9K44_16795 [Hyphomicrobiaceae bacterium]|nr:MAG: hypothetical protein F9K44_16795 [Hyphomicrobiaceae bacterium]